MRFKLYLSNRTTNRFEIHSVAISEVAIVIPGLNSIFLQMQDVSGFHSAGHKFSVDFREWLASRL